MDGTPSDPLCCPLTRAPLVPAPSALLAELQALAAARALRDESAALVTTPFDAAWVDGAGRRAWLVDRGIPLLLPGRGIVLPRRWRGAARVRQR